MRGKVLCFRQVSNPDIYTGRTPVNYEKGDPRISKQNVNIRADRANKELDVSMDERRA